VNKKYKNRAYSWLGWCGIVLGAALVVVDAKKIDRDFLWGGIGRVLSYALIAAVGLVLVRTHVTASKKGLMVVNPMRRIFIQWNEIVEIKAENMPVITLVNGREVRCFAVQRANGARVLGRRSYVDDVVDELNLTRVTAASGLE
jgi:hypothetical protein